MSEVSKEKDDSYIKVLWVGNCHINSPLLMSTALISPIELLKYITPLTITIDNFF